MYRIVPLATIVLLGWLSSLSNGQETLKVQRQADRLVISLADNVPAIEYVFSDPEILRPHFTRAHSPSGVLLTRNNPPIANADAADHATMHPGIWLAMGDISGHDFWRNKATIKQTRFSQEPTIEGHQLRFATECELLTAESKLLGYLANQFVILGSTKAESNRATVLVWQATFRAVGEPLVFGDQEEMGLGVRLATPLIEKKGGQITNSQGLTSAAKTWGQPASWCDYSGKIGERACGITVFSSPRNFRESRWHNRDYGLMVANPFAIAAMKQGQPSRITVPVDQPLTVTFALALHEGDYDPQLQYSQIQKLPIFDASPM